MSTFPLLRRLQRRQLELPGPQKPRNDAPAVALPEKSRCIYRVTMDDGYADPDQ